MPFEARARSSEQSATPTGSGPFIPLTIVSGLWPDTIPTLWRAKAMGILGFGSVHAEPMGGAGLARCQTASAY